MSKSKKGVTISIRDKGPLVSMVRITQDGYRTKKIMTEISIEAGSERIYISNLLDRPVSRAKEGVHFEFPFNFPAGRIKYDTSWGSAEIDKDQLKGANRNFITATRWFDISDSKSGVSCALLDAPIFESGALISDPFRVGNPQWCGWIRKTSYNSTVYSYVMNNYWQTNYKADQPGKALFRYSFLPHGQFREADSSRFAIEEAQPLIAATDAKEAIVSLLTISDTKIIATSIKADGNDLIVRLFNISNDNVEADLSFRKNGTLVVLSPVKEDTLKGTRIHLAAKETVLLRMMAVNVIL
jgi:alpha-mannosidase